MSFPYSHVLLIGATSGIGAAVAEHLIASGVKVTVVGRRKDRIDAFVARHGSEKASGEVLDMTALSKIPDFVASVVQTHPDIDCVFLNAGMQRQYDLSKPESFDLELFNQEITTNFTSFVALTHAFLPYLLKASDKRGIVYTGTHISLVPVALMPAYSASKAALDAFFMCVREQLRETEVKVTHLSPPLVQSELHDTEMGPEAGRRLGIPASQFAQEAFNEIASGNENIIIGSIGGSSREMFMEIVDRRKEAFDRLSNLVRGLMSK